MNSTFIFVGTSNSTLATSRFAKLQETSVQNGFLLIWFEKQIGIQRIFGVFKLFLLLLYHRKAMWICHGAYWPELILHMLLRTRYSVIVQGSEMNLSGKVRGKIYQWTLKNAYAIGCRTLDQMKAINAISAQSRPFILRMDEYDLPIKTDEFKRTNIVSARASASLYRQSVVIKIADQIKNVLNSDSKSIYLCYNGPDIDPDNEMFDTKLIGPINKTSLTKLLTKAYCIISIPKTDGLSNIVIEALIQGALIISSEASFKTEFEAFRDRFIIVPEKILYEPVALYEFLRIQLKEVNLDFTYTDALAVHNKFSFDVKSLSLLLGKNV